MSTTPHAPATPRAPHRRRLLLALAASTALAACGGGGGAAPAPDPGPSPGPAPGPTPEPPPPPPAPVPQAWPGFGGNAQHAAQSTSGAQALNRIAWQTPVDLAPSNTNGDALLAHYGSPLCTAGNTVIVAVKTSSVGDFRVQAHDGATGALIWQAGSDYLLPPGYSWVPSWNPALDANSRLYFPGAGGRVFARDHADAASGALASLLFYDGSAFPPSAFDTTVYINTPLTVDAAGFVYFGFVVTGSNPANLVSGIARLNPTGGGTWVGAAAAAGDNAISKVATNCAPALSADGQTLYVAVNTAPVHGQVQAGYLLALDSATLARRARVALQDPSSGLPANISDDGTSSPTVGSTGHVFYGVLANTAGLHNYRGWLLHFNADLSEAGLPGSFGWDNTPSVVPPELVPSYTGSAPHLLMCKYNNYAGTATGDGNNKIAILDPFASQPDPVTPSVTVMREVLTLSGPTPEEGLPLPAVREWCINTAAVDVPGKAVLANSEDGYLYRWDLTTNTFSQSFNLTAGVLEAYTPTAIAADGSVLAIQNATLYCVAG